MDDRHRGQRLAGYWLAELLLKELKVTPARDSNIISIAYSGADPTFTAAIANGFAQAYIDVTIELKVEPARQYSRWFGDQGKSLRDNLEAAQAKLSAYQQEKGIVANDERYDVETAKLSELSSQLIRVKAETSDARNKQKSGATGDKLPEVMASSVVAGLRSEIARQEAKLQEAAGNLGKNHPQYLRMESELAALKQKLEAETQLVTERFFGIEIDRHGQGIRTRGRHRGAEEKAARSQERARPARGAPARRRRREKRLRVGQQALHRDHTRESVHAGQRDGALAGDRAARAVVSETARKDAGDGRGTWHPVGRARRIRPRDARPAHPLGRRPRRSDAASRARRNLAPAAALRSCVAASPLLSR